MIYIITHKVFDSKQIIDSEHNIILHVGQNDNCLDTYIRDDTGDNISYKNESYCELTGLYWMWKNAPEKPNEIIGLVHYRRFFTTKYEDLKYRYFNQMPKNLSYSVIEKTLSIYDVVIPKKVFILKDIKTFYGKFHDISDIEKVRNCIEEIYPQYIGAFDKIMKSHNYIYGNMIICKREILNQYSKWLFDILFVLEKELSKKDYGDSYQKRVYGFLAERLLQVWLKYNKLNCYEFPVYNTEKRDFNFFDTTKLRLRNLIS